MTFKRYGSYSESGAQWLGCLPSHWKVDRLKASVRSCRNGIWGSDPDGTGDDLICIRVADFDRTSFSVRLDEPTKRKVTEAERSGRLLEAGNLLLEKSGGGEKMPVGAVVLYDHRDAAVCSNFVAKMEVAEGMYPRFWVYMHAAAYAVRLTERSIKQTSGIQNLDQSQYLEERVPYPPFEEQVAIATFLDRETAMIDTLAEEQRRLIGLLREKRQAVISHAVTKGLDDSAPMKDSGVEWLGDVPAHWETVALARLVMPERPITYGIVQPGQPDPDGRFMVRGQDYSFGWADPSDIFKVSPAVEEPYRRARLKSGDLVVTIVGAGTGNVAVVPDFLEGANITQTTARVAALNTKVDPRYLMLALTSWLGRVQVALYQKGAAQPGLNLEHLKAFRIALGPLAEQARIAVEVEPQLLLMDALVAEARRAISVLQERRAALISAAVTGKVDVRDLTAEQLNVEAA